MDSRLKTLTKGESFKDSSDPNSPPLSSTTGSASPEAKKIMSK